MLNSIYQDLDIVFNPEFLTEANANEDYKNQNRIIVGGERTGSTRVKAIFAKAFPKVPIIKTSSTIAETIKYVTNTFLAMKVSYANEIYQLWNCIILDCMFPGFVAFGANEDHQENHQTTFTYGTGALTPNQWNRGVAQVRIPTDGYTSALNKSSNKNVSCNRAATTITNLLRTHTYTARSHNAHPRLREHTRVYIYQP
jgi:hypothetical protein